MRLTDDLLPLLRCPRCRQSFGFSTAAPTPLGGAESGVLTCACGTFPVIDGIPIIQTTPVGIFEHTTGAAQVAGVAPSRLVALINDGRADEALLECLAFPVVSPALRRLLGHRLGKGAIVTRVGRWLGKRRLRAQVLAKRQVISAVDVFDVYQRGSALFRELGHYFTLRFCQPRHLAGLALLWRLPPARKPLLDVACGLGHFEHYLTERGGGTTVIGLDMNFFQLWIARHWVAPAAAFVCANVADGLPFHDDTVSSVFCSDAFHYLPDRARFLEEVARCAPARPVILTRVGNAEAMPNEGQERDLAGYLDDVGASDVWAFDEDDLLQCYLDRRDPFARARPDPAGLVRRKWLSLVWNRSETSAGPGADDAWPHEIGALGVNPIYRRTVGPNGDVRLVFEFPSAWYAYENHAMLSCHPRRATLTASQLALLKAGRFDDSLAPLIRQFVVIGMPRRFAPEA